MDAETGKWQRVEQLYSGALEMSAAERAAFLDQACAGDESLRREVESLLSWHERAGDFIVAPALEVAARMITEGQAQVPDQSLAGRQVDHYRILSLLGAGGMGQVYRALDLRLNREVAIKVLPAHLAQNREAMARFRREARALAALSHPNILAIYDFNAGQGISYAVTELLAGETLRARMLRSPLTPEQAIEIARSIAEGLSAAHDKGITHRDLKPENIFLTAEGGVKILDFGLARLQDTAPFGVDRAVATTMQATEPGKVMGTVPYMSPEQARGPEIDVRSDIFSFGCLLHEMLSGKPPFARGTVAETIAAILKDDPPKLDSPVNRISPALKQVIRRCLEKNREDRYQSGRDLTVALKSLAASRPISVRLRPAFLISIALALAVGAALVAIQTGIFRPAPKPAQVAGAASERDPAMECHLEPGPTEGRDKTYKLHFVSRVRGHLYIIAPGEGYAPTTLLTAQANPQMGVRTNQVEAGADFSFPAGDDNWIQVTSDDPVTAFTIIFSTTPLTAPGFLTTRANRALTAAEQRVLQEWRQRFSADSPELVPAMRGDRSVVTVTLSANRDRSAPVIFDIPISGK